MPSSCFTNSTEEIAFVLQKSITVYTSVIADVTVKTNMGVLQVNGIPMSGIAVPMVGFDNFKGLAVTMVCVRCIRLALHFFNSNRYRHWL